MSEFNKCQRSKEKVLEVIDNLSIERLSAISLNNEFKIAELTASITHLSQTVKFIDTRMAILKLREDKPNKPIKYFASKAS